jgi:predicted MFS family arabinose efflux permease
MFKPLLVDYGYNIKQIGLITGIAGTSLAAVSALAAGRIMRKQERWQSMRLFSLLILVATVYLLFTSIIDNPLLLISGILFVWVSYGFSTVGIYTTSMDVVRKGREGTDFTLQIVITHLSSLVIAVMSGRFADMVGYRGLFTAGVVMALISFIYVLKLYPSGKRP